MLFSSSAPTLAAEAPRPVTPTAVPPPPPPAPPPRPVEPSAIAVPALGEGLRGVRAQLTARIIAHVGDPIDLLDDQPTRARIEQHLNKEYAACGASFDEPERELLFSAVRDEFFGFGPIQPLLNDDSVSEVMVNRADRVYVERSGKSGRTPVVFDDDQHVRRIIEKILRPLGRRIGENEPLVDARLPDGSRVNAAIPPVTIDGPCITIRKFGKGTITADDLVRFGSMTQHLADFLKACVVARINLVVSGGTGSGKTTLLNVLSGFIPEHERIITIEDAAELKLVQDQVVRMETKRPNVDGSGAVLARELVRNALRMRPERIIVGECRGGETLDMLQAMNTGHDGSLTTLHANTPRDAISRMETMALMGGIDFPVRVVREQISSAVQLIVQQSRMRDGSRKITHVTEVAGMEGDKVILQEIFRFQEEGLDENGKVKGRLQPGGLRPSFQHKLELAGFKLPAEMFIATGRVLTGNGAPGASGTAPAPARW